MERRRATSFWLDSGGSDWQVNHAYHSADRLEEHQILARLRKGERVDHFETIRIAKDGRYVHISVTISPIRTGGNVVGASRLLATSRRSGNMNVSSRTWLRMQTSVHAVGPDGIILWANRHELEMLGYTLDEYVGQHISNFTPINLYFRTF